MKNKRLLIGIIAILLVIIAAIGGYKALTFAMDKYHYLRNIADSLERYNEENIQHYDFDYSWISDKKLVAHAFGGKGSKTYTNALEAFEYNYELGHRVFEVDFDLTDDGVCICSHDEDYWRYITDNENSGVEYTYENFKNTPLFTDYTPMDYKDVIDLLIKYPDIYIITDTKYADELSVYRQFSQIVDYAKEKDPEVLDRLIPQIYTEDMLGYVMNVHEFKSIDFTLYQIQWDKEEIAKFCGRSGVRFLTVSDELIEDDMIDLWKSMGIKIAVHTVDEEDRANELLDKGVDMIYTNYLEPESQENGESNE